VVDVFRTNDFDEATAAVSQVFYEHRFDLSPHARFALTMTLAEVGDINAGIIQYGTEIHGAVGGLDMTYSIGVPLRGLFAMSFAGEEKIVSPQLAAVTNPASQVDLRGWSTGTEQLMLFKFDQNKLETELGRLLGRDDIGMIDLAPVLDLRSGPGAQWLQLAYTVALALHSPTGGLATNPLVSAQLSSAIMTGMLLAVDHSYRGALSVWAKPIPSSTIRRAVAIVESRAHEPLTIPQVAEEVGCSVRALQAGYRKYLDMSPGEHLGRIRLERAHANLAAADPTTTSVAAIASAWGFRQPGRFAALYRKRYGVAPRNTLYGS